MAACSLQLHCDLVWPAEWQAVVDELAALRPLLDQAPENILADLHRQAHGLLAQLSLGEMVTAGEARDRIRVQIHLPSFDALLCAARAAAKDVAAGLVVHGSPPDAN